MCEVCGVCYGELPHFSTKQALKLHVKTVHDEDIVHKCEICGKTFVQRGHLKFHVKTLHNQINSHECVSCHKRFGKKIIWKFTGKQYMKISKVTHVSLVKNALAKGVI